LLSWGRAEEEIYRDEIQLLTKDKLIQTLAQTIENLWNARRDAVAHNAIRIEDYPAVRPDGTLHPRDHRAVDPSAPIDQYPLTPLQAASRGIAGVIGRSGSPVTLKSAVGEVRVEQAGEWKCALRSGDDLAAMHDRTRGWRPRAPL
jgi:hypothetical protein